MQYLWRPKKAKSAIAVRRLFEALNDRDRKQLAEEFVRLVEPEFSDRMVNALVNGVRGGAFKNWVSGNELDAGDVMTNLMNQVIIVCTSTTRPSSPVTGMTIFQTDTVNGFSNLLLTYTGTAWSTITPCTAIVPTAETTASGVYTDMATVGPTVKIQTGTSVTIIASANLSNNTAGDYAQMSCAVSGATTIGAGQVSATQLMPQAAANSPSGGVVTSTSSVGFCTGAGLNAGINQFQAKYSIVLGGTATIQQRALTVIGGTT